MKCFWQGSQHFQVIILKTSFVPIQFPIEGIIIGIKLATKNIDFQNWGVTGMLVLRL